MDSTTEIMISLRAGRALLGLSQEELAALAGVSRQIVVRLEKCEPNVLVDAIEKIRGALESGGVVFIDGGADHGPGVAMARSARRHIRLPAPPSNEQDLPT